MGEQEDIHTQAGVQAFRGRALRAALGAAGPRATQGAGRLQAAQCGHIPKELRRERAWEFSDGTLLPSWTGRPPGRCWGVRHTLSAGGEYLRQCCWRLAFLPMWKGVLLPFKNHLAIKNVRTCVFTGCGEHAGERYQHRMSPHTPKLEVCFNTSRDRLEPTKTHVVLWLSNIQHLMRTSWLCVS